MKCILPFNRKVKKAVDILYPLKKNIFVPFFPAMLFIAGYALSGVSCNNTNDVRVAEDVIYYYPGKNIYYDSLRSNYYYSLDSAKTWDSMAFRGSEFGAALGQKVAIPKTSNRMWLYNESHRKAYNGVILNIINSRSISLVKTDTAKKTKPAFVKPKPVIVEKEEPPKKGLKKFFSKLFGKKKKPVEEKKQ